MLSLFSLKDGTVEALFVLAVAAFAGWLLVNRGKLQPTQPTNADNSQGQGQMIQSLIAAQGDTFLLSLPGEPSVFAGAAPGTV